MSGTLVWCVCVCEEGGNLLSHHARKRTDHMVRECCGEKQIMPSIYFLVVDV